ncbi:flagellar hook-basal body complex protein FliE [Ferrimonas marina]|uniref:Flagellar hook-basal body complex protein FliE n=1 Tax=Ferrimonas marina TaxID=299255 RepID=A0A1M5TEM7_9GAMM|nr:flagellar hook-basal body complex protein FliE [Ferrimonas marina]SHH49168.1 flagellar hook-basal body complex protein FliE [Ferrimonas marina]
MSIEASLADLQVSMDRMSAQAGIPAQPPANQVVSASMADSFAKAMNEANQSAIVASQTKQALLRGDPNVTMAETLRAQTQASLSFDLIMEVRNKLQQAYQTISSQ